MFPMGAGTRFRPRQIEISMQSVQGCRGKFVSPFLNLRLRPTPVQADRILGEVLRKGQAILAFTDQDVAKSTARRNVVHVSA